MQALLVSTIVVAVAEIGDKTQLLSFILAARFRQPWPIIAGIFVSTILNHTAAGALGAWISTTLSPDILRYIVGVTFLAVAAWALVPDKLDKEPEHISRFGAFMASLIAFFIAEVGDKTQVATIALAAKYSPLWMVVVGTTLGMMLANIPAVFIGSKLAEKLPLGLIRKVAASIFALLGIYTLVIA